MSLNSQQWGMLTRLLYRFFRPKLVKLAADSSNTADDKLIQVADKLLK